MPIPPTIPRPPIPSSPMNRAFLVKDLSSIICAASTLDKVLAAKIDTEQHKNTKTKTFIMYVDDYITQKTDVNNQFAKIFIEIENIVDLEKAQKEERELHTNKEKCCWVGAFAI